jgi:hypothetical protein
MKSVRKGAWQSKRGPSPAIPAYRPPRQTRTSKKAESVVVPEIVACESEASVEIVESKSSDSEEDTSFGVVWEKIAEPMQTIQETVLPKACRMMSYREALEISRHGEVLRWSSDSEGETDKNDQAAKEKVSCPFDGLVIPETELQESPDKAGKKETVTETCLGMKVAKQFEAGLFTGEILNAFNMVCRKAFTNIMDGFGVA